MSPAPADSGRSLAPTPLEIAVGGAFGSHEGASPLGDADDGSNPRAALERHVLDALARPPCVVAFSGGRDSSAVLALASAVARREGLPLPIPVAVRFAHAPGTGEADWQDLVLRTLELDALRVDVTDELDLVGPVARALLQRHGVVHPPHAHLFAHVLARSGGRSLLTGFGGDQVLGGWIASRLEGRGRRSIRLAHAASPRRLRRAVLRGRMPDRPWLTASAREEVRRRWLDDAGAEPPSWRGYLGWLDRRRGLAALRWTLDRVAAEAGATVHHPFLDRSFLAALARVGGRGGLGDRSELMHHLVGDLLPEELLERRTKARYFYAYIRDPSRAFARRWDGRGLDAALVEPERLRAAWLALMPPGGAALALQAAWLASGRELDEPAGSLAEGRPVERPA